MESDKSKHEAKKTDSKIRIGYGVKLPVLTYNECITIIKKLANIGGLDGPVEALSQILNNSLSSSTFTFKVSALRNYGLISLDSNNYSLTDLSRRIIQPLSPEEEVTATFEAFKKLDTLNKIWENYKGKILPQPEFLSNWISKNIGIPASLAPDWAEYFIQAATAANIIFHRTEGSYQVRVQAMLSKVEVKPEPISLGLSTVNPTVTIEDKKTDIPAQKGVLEIVDQSDWGILNQKKVSGNRKAIFAIPDDLSENDIEAIKQIIKGIEGQLDGLRKREEK